jgi:hypothetical protein
MKLKIFVTISNFECFMISNDYGLDLYGLQRLQNIICEVKEGLNKLRDEPCS